MISLIKFQGNFLLFILIRIVNLYKNKIISLNIKRKKKKSRKKGSGSGQKKAWVTMRKNAKKASWRRRFPNHALTKEWKRKHQIPK